MNKEEEYKPEEVIVIDDKNVIDYSNN